jgi:hypothetical protein
MTRSQPHRTSTGGHTHNRLTRVAVAVVFALVVAAGAKGAFELSSSTMMTNIAFVGSWMMLCFGLAYAGVRIRPSTGGALLVGFGMGTLLVLIFGGMQMFG